MLIFLLFITSFLLLPQPSLSQTSKKPAQLYPLPTGEKIKIIGLIPADKKEKNHAPSLMLRIVNPTLKTNLEHVADSFFFNYWGPKVTASGKAYARLAIEVPGSKIENKKTTGKKLASVLKDIAYKQKEPGLWVPVKHQIPDWAKKTKEKEVKLQNGETIWIEKEIETKSIVIGQKSYAFNIRGNWAGSGSRQPLETIRQFANEKLTKLRSKYSMISLYIFRKQRKEGFHFRPVAKAHILKKSARDFWLISNFKYVQFSDDGQKASMIWYIPKKPFQKISKEQLLNQAQILQNKFGKVIAGKVKFNTSIIMALWPADEIGQAAQRYGVVFHKQNDGTWKTKK